MASNLYDNAKVLALTTGMNLVSGTVRAVLVDSSYVYSAAHTTFANLTGFVGPSTYSTGIALASKTTSGGVFDAADITFPSVASGTAVAVVLYVDGGSAAASNLIAYESFTSVVASGVDINLAWDNGAAKILAI